MPTTFLIGICLPGTDNINLTRAVAENWGFQEYFP
jgi:hypothetical protein